MRVAKTIDESAFSTPSMSPILSMTMSSSLIDAAATNVIMSKLPLTEWTDQLQLLCNAPERLGRQGGQHMRLYLATLEVVR